MAVKLSKNLPVLVFHCSTDSICIFLHCHVALDKDHLQCCISAR